MLRSPTKYSTTNTDMDVESSREFKRQKTDCEVSELIKSLNSGLNNSINDLRGDMNKQLTDISSNICTIRTELDCLNVSTNEIKTDIVALRADSTATKQRVQKIENQNKSFTESLSELKASTRFASHQLDGLQTRITTFENTSRSPSATVLALEAKIDSLEQQARQNHLEICNVPEKCGENLITILENIGTAIKCTISQADMPHGHQQNNRPKNMICILSSRTLRDNILSTFRKCKNTSSDQIGISGTPNKIHMNEQLTLQNKQLFRDCRQKAKNYGYKYVWDNHASILVRETGITPAFAVARHFYHKEMRIELLREELLFDTVHVTFQLTFDNRAFTLASLAMTREEKHLPISASVLFEIFPFCIVFGSDMVVRSIGNSLMVILPDLVGKKITNWFDLVRPLIAFKFQTILNRTNNIFELVTVEAVMHEKAPDKRNELLRLSDETENTTEKNLRLKGQMIYMDNWRMMMYLGTPVMPDLAALVSTGLYINDLSMHDFSRDLMLAGTQQSVELKLALDQEQQKSKKLEESMRKLDMEMKRTDELLYQMIPKQVADRLRNGENPIDTCEMFDSVSILFSDVVTFTEICSRITPMEVVSMLNAMYSIFDTLTERNRVYKVETIGDAYMVVSGAPEKEDNHAEKVCDMALDMVDAITDLKDPSTGSHLSIRVGVHSGAVVAGIVGLKMPRYCLFGDSVNTASRMESTSEAMRIHISQTTQELLSPSYMVQERGEIQVKGKGAMKTYWLEGRESRPSLTKMICPQLQPGTEPEWERAADARDSIAEYSAAQMINKEYLPNAVNSAPTSLGSLQPVSVRSSVAVAPAPVVTSPVEERRIYSPVTFQDVARRSIANSPNRVERDRESRSNSTSMAGVWTDVESIEPPRTSTFDSLNSSFCYSSTSPCRVGTAPTSKDREPDSFIDTCATGRMTPTHSAPPMVGSYPTLRPETSSLAPRINADEIETDTEYQDAHADDHQIEHVCSETVEESHPKPGKVGRFRARIAPGYHKNCTHKPITKDSIKEKNQAMSSGSVQPHGHHHTKNVNHHQCCGAFGNPHVRHKSSNPSCRLI